MPTRQEMVIAVNENDESTDIVDKLEAHQNGVLHRAFSVFVLNSKNELLLQQRAIGKYHSEGLWSNTCCSHPMPGEETIDAAHRRLIEEMGFDCPLEYIFKLRYKADVGSGLTENELDYVYVGTYDGVISPNNEEVGAYCYKPIPEIERLLAAEPETFTKWFHLALPKLISYIHQKEKAA
jgi:isopentenyl-diphosphate delta-isomerase